MSYSKAHTLIKNSTLRMAVILGERLLQGIKYEGEMLILTPTRWEAVLEYGNVDILLVESVENSFDGFWNTSASSNNNHEHGIGDIVNFARLKRIPTVFWITVGNNELEKYLKTAHLFDMVACADQLSVEYLLKLGLNAIYLPPCVQPAIFNQYHSGEGKNSYGFQILFDKSADLLKFDNVASICQDLMRFGICTIEVRKGIVFKENSREDSGESDCSIYELSNKRLLLLKNSKAYATFEHSLSSWTEQQWMILEAISCGLPVIHLGELNDNEILNGVITNCFSALEFKSEFYKYSINELYRKRIAHNAWRIVLSNHTYSHRINAICNILKISHDWVEFPMVSLISPTNKTNSINSIINTFQKFNYPCKELIIVDATRNGQEAIPNTMSDFESINLINIPYERFAGSALNIGCMVACGTYCFRIDDDDIYGENYVLDYILNTRSVTADIYGKCPSPITFEYKIDGVVYLKGWDVNYRVLDASACVDNGIWIGGNTFMLRREFVLKRYFSDQNYGSVDTEYLLSLDSVSNVSVAFIDEFNVVATRRKDLNSHTWRQSEKQIVANREEKKLLGDIFV